MVAPGGDVALDGGRAQRRRANRGSDEAIAAPRYRLDAARLFRVVAERRTHFADGRLEHRVGDEAMTPDKIEQRVLRHQDAGAARQCAKHFERLRRESYGFSVARQPCLSLIQLETVEAQPRDKWIRFHARAPFTAIGMGKKGLATPGALLGGGARRRRKAPGPPRRGRESHASTLSACRSARHCDEVHPYCA